MQNRIRTPVRRQASLRALWRKNFERKKKATERVAERRRFLVEQKERIEKTKQILALAKSCGAHANSVNPIETPSFEKAREIVGLLETQKGQLTVSGAKVLRATIGELEKLEADIEKRRQEASKLQAQIISYNGKRKPTVEMQNLRALCSKTIGALEQQQNQIWHASRKIRGILEAFNSS